jgi:arabinogalactan oligomer / maltooligosaccharide transport system substrate-binding protein
MTSRRITTLLVAMVALAVAAIAGGLSGSAAAGQTPAAQKPAAKAGGSRVVRIWADRNRKADVEAIAGPWARRRGLTVQVVEKEFGDIRDGVKTVAPDQAPDVIVGAHDWVGKLAADGSVVTLRLRNSVTRQFPKYALDAFSYGRTRSALYGVPVAVENIGLVVNTRLASVPKNWVDLERKALAFKRKGSNRLAIAVQQGAGGDAYHMYPFFSGLCGYVFGKTRGGALNPGNIGLRGPSFLKNAPMIDRWNRIGLINSKVDGDAAKAAFLGRRAAYWVTGPWNAEDITKAGIQFRVVQVPRIKCNSVPFLGAQGFMVTRFARTHGVEAAAKDLVGSYLSTATAQAALSTRNDRYPANLTAAKRVTNRTLKAFGAAGRGGVPMPNIPAMDSVWTDLGAAWVKSTKGAGATKARSAFFTAARNIANKIG